MGRKKTLIILLSLILQISYAQDKIEFEAPLIYPEGVAYSDKIKTFFVSSVTTGTIGAIDPSGKYSVFYRDSTLKSTFGMKVDEKRSRLWICSADPNYSQYSDDNSFQKMSQIIALDLKSGKKIATVDLASLRSGKHFANDLTLDGQGNLYVTDSFSPVIYKVDLKDHASIFAESDLFKSKAVGLNGIAFHPSGYLLVVNNSNGSILKVDLKNPSAPTKVKIEQFFPGADGLLVDKQKNLILIQNKGVNKVFKITSADEWKSAQVVSSTNVEARFNNPTTATFVNENVFVLNSKLTELADSTKNPSLTYSIQQAKFTQ